MTPGRGCLNGNQKATKTVPMSSSTLMIYLAAVVTVLLIMVAFMAFFPTAAVFNGPFNGGSAAAADQEARQKAAEAQGAPKPGPPPQPQGPPPPPMVSIASFVTTENAALSKTVTKLSTAEDLQTFLEAASDGVRLLVAGWEGCGLTRRQLGVLLSDEVKDMNAAVADMHVLGDDAEFSLNSLLLSQRKALYTGAAPHLIVLRGDEVLASQAGFKPAGPLQAWAKQSST